MVVVAAVVAVLVMAAERGEHQVPEIIIIVYVVYLPKPTHTHPPHSIRHVAYVRRIFI